MLLMSERTGKDFDLLSEVKVGKKSDSDHSAAQRTRSEVKIFQ